jgi:DNA-binding NarL/FixJ family response regulator
VKVKRVRVLLADDHKIVVEGLRSLLQAEFELAGTVGDGRALVAAALNLHPDVIVADISMPLLNGIEAARQLKKSGVKAKIIFLTMQTDLAYAIRALEAGASGYVLKHSATSELVKAIRDVLKGNMYVTPLLAKEGLESFMDRVEQSRKTPLKLTDRQQEILQLLAEGRSAKEVGGLLNISTRTVEFHKYRIMENLQLRTTAELVQYAIKHRIVSM